MAESKEKTYVEDVDRSVYDIRDEEHDAYRMEEGLTPAIVDRLSKEKNDPVWMQQFRLQSLQIYNELPLPNWGPSIEGLDMAHIATYVRPNTKMQNDWENVPQDIKDTFERLGIPQAERKSLAGVGAQYDSELVYHNVKDVRGRRGRGVYRHGERPPRGVRRHGEKVLHETGHPPGPQVCRPSRGGVVRRLLRLCAQGGASLHPPAVLLPAERQGGRPV